MWRIVLSSSAVHGKLLTLIPIYPILTVSSDEPLTSGENKVHPKQLFPLLCKRCDKDEPLHRLRDFPTGLQDRSASYNMYIYVFFINLDNIRLDFEGLEYQHAARALVLVV